MKSKNNLAKQINHHLSQMNNNIRDQVQNQLVVNTLRVLLIIYSAFVVPMLKPKHVNVVDQQIVRFILVAIIIYLSFIDLPSAILLTIAFLVTLQKVNKSNGNKSNNSHIKDVSLNTLIKNLNNEVKQIPVKNVINNNQVNNAVSNNKVNNNNSNNNSNKNNSVKNHAVINDNTIENFEAHNNLNNNKPSENLGNNTAGLAANSPVDSNVAANEGTNVGNVSGNLVGQMLNSTETNNNNNSGELNGMPSDMNQALLEDVLPSANDNAAVNKLQVFDNNNASNKGVNSGNVNSMANNNNMIDQVNQEQPASETLTEGILRAQGAMKNNNAPMGLTTGDDLYTISENAVPEANIMAEVKTFQNQHSTQNLGKPMGLGAKRYDGYHFRDGTHPNLEHAMLRNENF